MEELEYFSPFLLGAIPFVISGLKMFVPVLWREALAALVSAIATTFVIIRTPLTLGPGIFEGIALFFLLIGSRGLMTGIANVAEAAKKKVPMFTVKGKVIRAAQRAAVPALIVGVALFAGRAWADSTTTTIPIVEEAVKEPKLWVLIVSQAIARVLDWFLHKH